MTAPKTPRPRRTPTELARDAHLNALDKVAACEGRIEAHDARRSELVQALSEAQATARYLGLNPLLHHTPPAADIDDSLFVRDSDPV